jgi:dCTP deaminase
MTILCDYEIKALCNGGMVRNYDEALVNPASLDLQLGDTIMLESAEDLDMRPLSIAGAAPDNPYWLRPGQFILAQTIEVFHMPEHIAGLFFLKSSRAREGYENLHAGYADPGWNGSVLTLELKNSRQLLPLPLWPGLKIGQMVFFHMSQRPVTSYAEVGHYNHRCVALLMPLAPASGFATAGWLLVPQVAAHTQANQSNLQQHVTHATALRWQLRGIVLPLYELTDSPCLTLLVTT